MTQIGVPEEGVDEGQYGKIANHVTGVLIFAGFDIPLFRDLIVRKKSIRPDVMWNIQGLPSFGEVLFKVPAVPSLRREGLNISRDCTDHRLLDLFDGLGEKSHLYSLNKCSITKCAEDSQ